ncbi:uncharacterized protein KZ484_010591 isoform 2-T2 [Pholidichthys leucotaenia]
MSLKQRFGNLWNNMDYPSNKKPRTDSLEDYNRCTYYGLENQGATCYLNSVLQVLFMTKDFREAVLKYVDEKPASDFDHSLADLFKKLQKDTAETRNITKLLGISNVNEQRDAAEYLERVLTLTSPDISKTFHGCLVNKITCTKGHIATDRDAAFWHLPLPLMDSSERVYSVVDGIDKFFRGSDLSGKNQMYCDQCDDKVDAKIKDVMKHHPDVLILLLKRFEFSYSYMSYVKINQAVDVPYILQIPESDGVESQTYELYAVVDHVGDLRSGHYTTTIKSPDEDNWYKFDDASITLYKSQSSLDTEMFPRSRSAYLLFYRKKKADIQNTKEVSTSEIFQPTPNEDIDQDAEKISKREEGKGTKQKKKPNQAKMERRRNQKVKMKQKGKIKVDKGRFT